MASKNLVSNLKVITSGSTPTTSELANGEFAFGLVGGVARLFGNVGDTIYEFSLVRSVAGKIGNVTLSKADVGLNNVDNVRQYSASNKPPYPVTSVNGKVGAVTIDKTELGLATVALTGSYNDLLNKPTIVTDAVRYNAQSLSATQQAQARENIGANATLQFKNVQIAANAFVADTTYADYPYRAAVALSGVTDTASPNVCFDMAEATSGNYAPVANSYNGGIYLYAKATNSAQITIPFISVELAT